MKSGKTGFDERTRAATKGTATGWEGCCSLRFTLGALVCIALASLTASSASAQDFTSYWQTLESASSAGDFSKVRKLVQSDESSAERAFFQAADHYVQYELQGNLEGAKKSERLMRDLGNAFDIQLNNKDYTLYGQFLGRLNLVKKQQWSDSYGKYVDFMIAYQTVDAQEEPDEEAIRAALEASREPIQEFEDIGDFYLQGIAYRSQGILHARLEGFDEAKRSFELAKACFSTFGSEKGVSSADERLTQTAVAKRTKEQAEEAADVDRRDEPAEPAEPGEPQWKEIELVYRVDRRGLEPTANPYSVEEYLLWPRTLLIKSDPANFWDIFERNERNFASYYQSVFGRWPAQDSLLYPFLFSQTDNRVALDVNDDGRIQRNEVLKATTSPNVFEFEDLPAKSGGTFDYAVELVDIGQETWFGQANSTFANEGDKALAFRRACHREGGFEGRTILLIDDNTNGVYNEAGMDSLFLEGDDPCFLGNVMRIGDAFYEVRIGDLLGKKMQYRPFEGETGSIAVDWSGKVKPSHLFVRGVDGDVLNAVFRIDVRGETEVPAGKYHFYFGFLQSGKGRSVVTAEMRKGDSEIFEVEPQGTHTLRLGDPFRYEFAVSKGDEGPVLRGRDLKLYGASGELYTKFYGEVVTPKFTLKRQGGGVVERGSMRRVEYEDRVNDPDSVWYPRDYPLDARRIGDVELEARFSASSRLLGTIKTDFVKASD